jgi:hypothetical protein
MVKQAPSLSRARWRYLWIAAAALYALPVGKVAYDDLTEVTRKMRARLIAEHRLWELQPGYRGRPETWTNAASRLLTDRQLLRRIHAKYGERAESIALDYRRDLSIAQAERVLVALAIWGVPVAGFYGIGWALAKRRRRPPPAPPPARPAYDESRYRPKP